MMPLFSSIAMAAPAASGGTQANPMLAFAPFLLMFVVMYFLILRPQQKRQKQHELLLNNLKKGDRVVTSGGMLGTVVGVKDKEVVLRVGDGDTKIEFLKSAISAVLNN